MILLDKIQKYPKKTLEQSLADVMKSKNRMISGKFAPIVFNMPYVEVKYKSIDGKTLYGWLIKREGATKTMVFLHGRFNNRIFCLKFLQLFLDMDLSEEYNIFIPDLRNSGKSDSCKTAFGYYFAFDVYSTMLMLKSNFGYNNFVLYGFSQGAMGAAVSLNLFEREISENEIIVEKMILDSPVSNVKKIIIEHAKIFNFKLPLFIMLLALAKLNKIVDYKLGDMCLSKLLGKVPTLIIQSKKDKATPFEIVEEEYELLKEREKTENLAPTRFKAFRKGQHVRIYLEYKNEYTQTINNFLESRF